MDLIKHTSYTAANVTKYGFDFSPSNATLYIPSADLIDIDYNDFLYQMWVKPNTLHNLFSRGNGLFGVTLSTDNISIGNTAISTTVSGIHNTNWKHIAVFRKNFKLCICINGVIKSIDELADDIASLGDLFIGRYDSSDTTQRFDGIITNFEFNNSYCRYNLAGYEVGDMLFTPPLKNINIKDERNQWIRFDDEDSTYLALSSKNGLDVDISDFINTWEGHITGTVLEGTTGNPPLYVSAEGLEFTSGTSLQETSNSPFSTTGGLSMSFYIKLTTSNLNEIIQKYENTSNLFKIEISTTNIKLTNIISASSETILDYNASLSQNKWYYISIVRNTSELYELSIDKSVVSTSTSTSNLHDYGRWVLKNEGNLDSLRIDTNNYSFIYPRRSKR